MLKDLLTEDFINVNVQCSDWKKAIKEGTKILIEENCIEKKYEDAIFNNFKKMGTYMVIAPGIVLSHARPENGVKKISMSIVTLKNPINFGSQLNDPVKLIVTLAAKDSEGHLKALSQLMEIFMNSKDLENIFNAKDKNEIIKIVQKYSK